MIKRFRVQNYKALRDVTLDLTPVHVLIGANDSGKTSIVEALAALSRSATVDLSHAFRGKWEGNQLVWCMQHNASVILAADVECPAGLIEYELAVRFWGGGRSVQLLEEKLKRQASSKWVLLDSRPHGDTVLRRASLDPEAIDAEKRPAVLDLIEALKGAEVYRWIPSFLGLPTALDPTRRFRLDASGFGLASCLDDMLSDNRQRFDEIEEKFRALFDDNIERIILKTEPAFRSPPDPHAQVPLLKETQGKGLLFQFKGIKQPVPASQVSDGMLLVLAYLTILNLPDPPRLLLVEEPENGFHPERLFEVVKILRQLIADHPQTQMVLTTHSPYMLDHFQPEEVTLCRKTEDGSVAVTRLSASAAVREQIDLLGLGEIWTAQGEEEIARTAPSGEGSGG